MFLRTLSLALALTIAAAPAASAMGERPATAPVVPQEADAPASIAEMEAAAGQVLMLGPRLTFETAKGSFTIVTFPKEAPQTVEQVVRLVESGFYDGLAFHRVVPGFVAQVGDPATRTLPVDDPKVGRGGSGKTLPPEFPGQRVKHLTGTVGMARGKAPGSADSQFYVTLAPVDHLNRQYTVFGQVIRGMEVLRAIEAGDTITKATVSSRPAGPQTEKK